MTERKTHDPAERRAILDDVTDLILQGGVRPTTAAKSVAKTRGLHFATIFRWAEADGRPLVDLAGVLRCSEWSPAT